MSNAAALPAGQREIAMQSRGAAGLPSAIGRQAAAAVEEADAVLLTVDGQAGATAGDEEILSWLRREHPGKAVALAVNKCDNAPRADEQAADFWGMGLEPLPLSAISGSGESAAPAKCGVWGGVGWGVGWGGVEGHGP
jgi:GTP-binding protein